MGRSAVAPEDVSATYFVGIGSQCVGSPHGGLVQEAALYGTPGAPVRRGNPHKGLLVELRNSDAIFEFTSFSKSLMARASWPWSLVDARSEDTGPPLDKFRKGGLGFRPCPRGLD